MLVAHDLLLLMLDDDTGKIVSGFAVPDTALAGAVLIDLAARGLVDVAGPGAEVRKGRVMVRSGAPPEEPVLRDALALVREQAGVKPRSMLGPLAKGLRDRLAAELVGAGLLRAEQRTVLGLFRVTRLPATGASHERELRERLAAVLAGTRDVDDHTGALIALLHATNSVRKVVPVHDRRLAKRRATEIAAGDWAATAVRRAVQQVQQAVAGAVAAAVSASSGE